MTTYYSSLPLPALWDRQRVRGFSPNGEEVWIKRYRVFTIRGKLTILEYIGEHRPGKAWTIAERLIGEDDSICKMLPLERTLGLEFQLGQWYRVWVDPMTRIKMAYPKAKDRGFAWLQRLQLLNGGKPLDSR